MLQRNRLFAGWADITDDRLATFVDVHMFDTDMLGPAMPEFSERL
jgi:hypothetical protein